MIGIGKDNLILLEGSDHSYRTGRLVLKKVVYNIMRKSFEEYIDDCYINDGEEIVQMMWVAE